MATVLHVVAHHASGRGDTHSPEHLVSVSHASRGNTVRVLEAYIAPPGAPIADLALSERELPEVISVLHQANEVHVHGMPLVLALNLIPYVKPEVLVNTPLYLHGPWPLMLRQPSYDATRLQSWPGPVHYDPVAAASGEADDAPASAPLSIWLDPSDPVLLPRSVGAVPHQIDLGHGSVCAVSADVDAEVRQSLTNELQRLSTPRLRIEVLDESVLPPSQRPAVRRVTQAAIVDAGPSSATLTMRATLEAIAQGLPVLCIGERPEHAPDGLSWIARGDPQETALACVDVISTWLASWHDGQAAPVDTTMARDWILARIHAL